MIPSEHMHLDGWLIASNVQELVPPGQSSEYPKHKTREPIHVELTQTYPWGRMGGARGARAKGKPHPAAESIRGWDDLTGQASSPLYLHFWHIHHGHGPGT